MDNPSPKGAWRSLSPTSSPRTRRPTSASTIRPRLPRVSASAPRRESPLKCVRQKTRRYAIPAHNPSAPAGPLAPPGYRLSLVRICLVVLLLLTAIVVPGHRAHAQSLEPRSYANTPVGINFLLLGYGHLEGDVAFDASSPLKDARVHSRAVLVAYARSLDVWGLSGKILVALPVRDASGSAKLKGQERERDVLGLGDPLLRVSVNFFGAPALSMAEYPAYRQDVIVGASLQVTAPLGQYDADKLLNIGTNRWSFKPELGVSKAWGSFILELIPAVTFFTNNDDFLNRKTLKQDPIYSLQGHLIYEFSPALWAAFDATYYTGGRTNIHRDQGEQVENVSLGINRALALKL